MILSIQVLLITVLVLILSALYIEERRKKNNRNPAGRLTQIWDGSERRRFVRIAIDIPVWYSIPNAPDDKKDILSKDISVGGMCMTVNEKLSPNAILCLEMKSEDSREPIAAKGRVVWVKENTEQKNKDGIRYFDIGVEFRNIAPRDRRRLFNFINNRNP